MEFRKTKLIEKEMRFAVIGIRALGTGELGEGGKKGSSFQVGDEYILGAAVNQGLVATPTPALRLPLGGITPRCLLHAGSRSTQQD